MRNPNPRIFPSWKKESWKQRKGEANSIAWGKGTRPNSLYWVSVLLGIGVGAGLAAWGFERSPVTKAFDSLSDEPGITVSTSLTGTLNQADGPPSNEFTAGSDVSIFADIIRGHRGKKEASVEYLDGSEIVAIDMSKPLFLDVLNLWFLP